MSVNKSAFHFCSKMRQEFLGVYISLNVPVNWGGGGGGGWGGGFKLQRPFKLLVLVGRHDLYCDGSFSTRSAQLRATDNSSCCCIEYVLKQKRPSLAQRYSTLLHLPPLRFHCVGGCWDPTQDCCDLALTARRSNHSARSHPH
jgi:hypothetical protein